MTTSPQVEVQVSSIVQSALRSNLMNAYDNPMAVFIDLEIVEANIASLRSAFPDSVSVLHAFAVKANPLVGLLAMIREAGMGCEVASPGEFALAVAAGLDPEEIVFDAPAKRTADIERALSLGVTINVDNFQELERIAEVRSRTPTTSRIGLRVNPQIGTGAILSTSTASATSKFGVPIGSVAARAEVIRAFIDHPWLTALHVHSGSQGVELELNARCIQAVTELADEIDSKIGESRIDTIDIGGGMSVDFSDSHAVSDFAGFVSAVQSVSPTTLDGRRRIITEFGRSIIAKAGFTVSYVEATKDMGDRRIAITHAGVNVAARTVYHPEEWPLRISVMDPHGSVKLSPELRQDIAGPCCFAGDVIAWQRSMSELERGDLVALLDTGGYYATAPYSYNSMPMPGIYGVRSSSGEHRFVTLRRPQTLDEIVAVNSANSA